MLTASRRRVRVRAQMVADGDPNRRGTDHSESFGAMRGIPRSPPVVSPFRFSTRARRYEIPQLGDKDRSEMAFSELGACVPGLLFSFGTRRFEWIFPFLERLINSMHTSMLML